MRIGVWFACWIVPQYHLCVCDEARQGVDGVSKVGILKNHPVAARILRRWRELTGGKAVRDEDRRTVVACSGGADSVALAAVLAAVEPRAIIAHVVHDIRGDGSAIADRDAARRLAGLLGCDFVERSVEVKDQSGNLEGNARAARYEALCAMADEVGARFVATGHHGDDQLETLLMRLMRGSGVRGMGGIGESMEMGGVVVVRPMLEVRREEIELLCNEGGLSWQHDWTNDDQGYLRNRIRHLVLPMLRAIEPEIAVRASGFARSCRAGNAVIERVVREGVVSGARRDGRVWSWARDALRDEPEAVLGELMFVYARDVLGGVGADSIGRRGIEECVRGIKSESTEPRVHRVGPIVVAVGGREVVFSPAEDCGDG